MNLVEEYLRDLRDIHQSGSGVDETSYYTSLSNLLNEVGRQLKPKVRCIMNLRNQGAGMPDGGLFTPDQFPKGSHASPPRGTKPARGVIEAKPTKDDAWVIADSEQVNRYWKEYQQVLVTNYRDFILLGRDTEGAPVKLERFQFAKDEKTFWKNLANPKKVAEELGEQFFEYLKRVLLYAAPLSSPKDVAWFLASYARDARSRVDRELPALSGIRIVLEEGLGLKFQGPKGDHFFRSTLVQTLFYGVFSGWVLWSKRYPRTDRKVLFDWKLAAFYLRVPILRKLFHELTEPGQLDNLRLSEVLDWTASALNRVDRTTFFEQFEEGHAVQYFYEPFLEAFDPELRKDLGVWFTPIEIVQYMVGRVDALLKEELDVPDGLADPRVYVLDPCCGTGAYLVEVLKKINSTLEKKGVDALHGDELKQAAMERVVGFEILPAPFVVAHLQLGLLLQNAGCPFSEKGHERAAIFLTNSLTGWEPPKEPKTHLGFPEMEEERDAAEEVKREKPILVILGNPPYNAFAGVSPVEEQGLVEAYKEGLISEWRIRKFNLDDLYVRFFRLAERRIADKTGKGIIAYISNSSYLSDPSFVVMRQRFLEEFDSLWFDCMNGDSRQTGKLTPDGKPDPSVFSTEYNREGIRVGTTIGFLARAQTRKRTPTICFRQFWGVNKRTELVATLKGHPAGPQYQKVKPEKSNRFSFMPTKISAEYLSWPKITEFSLMPPFNGPVERRGFALISVEKKPLVARMKSYFDPNVSDSEIESIYHTLMMTGNRIVGPEAREKILQEFKYDDSRIVRYPFKPYDVRWCYLENLRPLFSEPSPQLLKQRSPTNAFLITRDTADKDIEGSPFFYSRLICDYDCISGHARHFPVMVRATSKSRTSSGDQDQVELFTGSSSRDSKPIADLSSTARTYLITLKLDDPDRDVAVAELIWKHALAVGYSPLYLAMNADGVRQDWPRIPLPRTKRLLLSSAELGGQVASLLDSPSIVTGVTAGPLRPEMTSIAVVSCVGGGRLNPDRGDLRLTAGWGHAGKDGVTMPGRGKVVRREYSKEERLQIDKGIKLLHLSREEAYTRLGETTCDVYLNEKAFWGCIPSNVWEYTIGGYQVIKKWLSYREESLLNRSLTSDEVHEVMNISRRIAAIILLGAKLDESYEAVRADLFPWKSMES